MSNEEDKELENYVSDDGVYLIPVEWGVYSTVQVSGKDIHNLKDALNAVNECIDDIPTSPEHEYIDGSYKVGVDIAEDAINAQHYRTISSIRVIKENGEIKIKD